MHFYSEIKSPLDAKCRPQQLLFCLQPWHFLLVWHGIPQSWEDHILLIILKAGDDVAGRRPHYCPGDPSWALAAASATDCGYAILPPIQCPSRPHSNQSSSIRRTNKIILDDSAPWAQQQSNFSKQIQASLRPYTIVTFWLNSPCLRLPHIHGKYRRMANPILRPSLTFPNFSPGTALPSPRVCLHAGFSRLFLLSFDFYKFDSIITRTIPFKDNQPCDHLNNPLFFPVLKTTLR